MLFYCRGCQRTFDEAGFCPFDGTPLASMSDARTIDTGPMRAEPDPPPTASSRHLTLPLTPSPSAAGPAVSPAAGPPAPAPSPSPAAAAYVPAPGGAVTAHERPSAPSAPPAPPAPPTDPPPTESASASAPIPAPTPPTDPLPTESASASAPILAPTPPPEPPRLRAVSASEDPRPALASYDSGRVNEYDKLVGQTLDGRYVVERKIGEGGMGVVFAVRHAVIERPLAIKVLKREVMRDEATVRRFVQEAKAASRIGHPNIVDVTDFGTTPDGMTYSVMEYVAGQTLGAALRRTAPFELSRSIRIAAQIARALGAAHDKGIVHRDLKPENVFLVNRDGRPDFVKIVDFGIAKVTPLAGQAANEPRLTRVGSVFGTPEYMAPEQAAGRSDTDGRADIYALGVILYQMVTGRVPHKGDSMVRTLAMQMLDPAMPPSKVRPDLSISPELEALIMKALAKQREHRFETMSELLAALDQLQAPVGVSVTGSAVYALVPLPPGADPALFGGPDDAAAADTVDAIVGAGPGASAVPQAHASGAAASPVWHPGAPGTPAADASGPIHVPPSITDVMMARARTPTGLVGRRHRDEPELVAHEHPRPFDPTLAQDRAPRAHRTWPVLLLAATVVLGGGGALAFFLTGRARGVAGGERPTGPAPADAALLAQAPPDAPADAAAPPAGADAGAALAAAEPPDAGVRPAGRPRNPGGAAAVLAQKDRRPVEIQVLTRPEGAALFVGKEPRGAGGARLVEPFGTRLELTCKQTGYKDGKLKLVFDGKHEAELCILQRIVICIPGVKNPFDQCPD